MKKEKVEKCEDSNHRRSSGTDRGKYVGSHDIVPPGTGEFDAMIDTNDQDE